MQFKLILSLLLLALFQSAWAQPEKIYHQVDEQEYSLKNISSNNEQILSIVKLCSPSNPDLKYSLKAHGEINKINQQIEVKLAIGNFFMLNDFNYKTFDINTFLIPQEINYKAELKDDNQTIQQYSKDNEKFKSGKYLIDERRPFNEGSNTKIVPAKIDFLFSEKQTKELVDYIETIDKYYDADAQLSLINKELNSIKPDSIEMLSDYLAIFNKNEAIFKTLKSERFASKLHLASNDPLKIISTLGQTSERNKNLQKQVESALGNMHLTYYNKGMEYLNRNEKEEAESFFNQALEIKPSFPPARFQNANLKYQKNGDQGILAEIQTIINTLKPDNDTRYLCYQLAEKIIFKNIASAQKHLDNAQAPLAKPLIDTCKVYTENIEGIRRFPELNEVEQKYYQSLFELIVHKASINAESDLPDEALALADSAEQFIIKNAQQTIHREKLNQLTQNLYFTYLDLAQNFLTNNDLNSALHHCSQAQKVCSRFSNVACTQDLDKAFHLLHSKTYGKMLDTVATRIDLQMADAALSVINRAINYRKTYKINKQDNEDQLFLQAQQIKYIDLVSSGNAAQNHGKHREALAFYKEAEDLGMLYSVQKDDDLHNKLSKAAKGYIFQLCEQGVIYVENLSLKNAAKNLNLAKSLKSTYIANTDNEVEEAINKLISAYQRGNCNQALHLFNVQVNAARKFIGDKEFVYATNAFKKAINIADKNQSCIIPDSIATIQLKEIRALYKYQVRKKRIEEQIEEKEFADAITDYYSLTDFYDDSCENNFGITHQEPFSFIKTHRNGQLADYAIQYYIQDENAEKAQELLESLLQREYIKSWSKESQTKLGTYLAQLDYEKNSKNNPKTKVYEYLKDEKWYRYLKKAYLKEWKRQVKEHRFIEENQMAEQN